MVGYFFSLLSSLFFTMYAIPKKFAKLKPVYYVLFMGISCFIISGIFYILFRNNEALFNNYLLLSFVGGLSWFAASVLFFYCIDKIGVAISTQFKSLQGPFGSIMILFGLSEYANLNVYYLMIAILFVFLSSIMLVVKDENKERINEKYIFIAILSAFLYGVAGFFRKVVTLQGYVQAQQLYSSFGIVIGSIIYIFIFNKKIEFKKENIKEYSLSFLSGFFYYFASFFMLLSYKYIEGSIAFSIIQLNALWASIIGVFIFKEIDYKKHYLRLLFAFFFALIGIGLLILC